MARRAMVHHPGWLEAPAVIALTATLALVGPDLTPRRPVGPSTVSSQGPLGLAAGRLTEPDAQAGSFGTRPSASVPVTRGNEVGGDPRTGR